MSSKAELKVVLLGKECVGKTSLLERFIHNRFVERSRVDRPYQATIGAAFASKQVSVSDTRAILLAVWDTAGSERYESMSRIYYRNARAAIVCYDVTDESSFRRAAYWVSEVRANEEMCRLYLCQTKTDVIEAQPQHRRVSAREAQLFGQSVSATVVETSAKTGRGVEQLFRAIAAEFVDDFEMKEEKQSFELLETQRKSRNFCCF